VAKAIERIGDHATNIAECVVYAVNGIDIRHAARKQLERDTLSS
jgi:phosphate transport system protein